MMVQFEAKVHDIFRRCTKPRVVGNTLAGLCTQCFVPKILAVKFAVTLRSRWRKRCFWTPDL